MSHRAMMSIRPWLWSEWVWVLLENVVHIPVIVENDGNAAAWGEFRLGAGVDVEDLTVVTVGTGIGGHLGIHPGWYLAGSGTRGFGGDLGPNRICNWRRGS